MDFSYIVLASYYFEKGCKFFFQFRYKEAKEFFEKALLFIEEVDDKRKASLYLALSQLYNNLSEFQKAILFLEKAKDLKNIFGDKLLEPVFYFQYGIAYQGIYDYNKSIECLKKAYSLCDNEATKLECLSNLGLNYLNLANNKKAKENLEKSLAIAEEIKDNFQISSCLSNLGLYWFRMSEYQKAILFLEKAKDLKNILGDKLGEAKCHGNLGDFYTHILKYDDALKSFQKALELSQEIGDKKTVIQCFLNIVDIYIILNKQQKALDFINIIEKETDDKKLQMVYHITYGKYYANIANYDDALKSFQKALELAQEIGDKERIVAIQAFLGMTFFKLNQFDLSISQLREAIKRMELIGKKYYR
jgi:tetratricopeptide (TPR) repeat protein